MASMKSSEKKRIVPLSADLLSDIVTHRNEYHTPPGHYIEADQVGDNRASGQYATTSSPQSLPSGARRRTVGFADGPIVATTTASELRPSVGQTRLQTRLGSLASEVQELRNLLPKPNSQYEEPCTGGLHCLRRSQSHLSLSFKSSSDLRLVNSSSDLHLRDEKSLDNRHRNRQFNLDLQKHLANMLKSRTSLFLSQRKE
ncbi:GM14445 [Drosophila sechellia]|uniref:GM14445 n=2 Tax=Drosophila sechellia TaxID=7238 RepID=B4HXN9_DROSE|nr:GM14445 [Drosophila sechellia]